MIPLSRQQKLSVTGHTLAAASHLLGGTGGGHKLSVASQALAAAAADGGGITFEALKAQLTKHEGLLQVITNVTKKESLTILIDRQYFILSLSSSSNELS